MSLVARDLSLTHNGEVFLQDVSFTAKPGITVLVGPTLSGKTTLMRALAGLIKTDSGTVTVNGVDVGSTSVKDRSVSFVYQQFINYPSMSVFDNIASPLRVQKEKLSKEQVETRVKEVAGMLRITELLDRKPSELSGGQQQRVAIARSLSRKSDLVLLDEPLANLDFKLREQLRDELQRIFIGAEMTVIYSTAEPLEALDMASHTIVMNQGRVEQDGEALSLYSRPKNIPVAQAMSDPPLNLIASTTTTSTSATLGNELRDKFGGIFTLGIRPHNVSIKAQGSKDIGLNGTVRIAEITGSSTYVHLDLGNSQNIVMEVNGSQNYPVGSTMTVYLDRSAVYGFHPKNGTTLFTPTEVR